MVLLVSGVLFMNWMLQKPNTPQDPQAMKALQLVKAHQSRKAPTIEQAINNLVNEMEDRGQSVHVGEWRAAPEKGDVYMVSIVIREKGAVGWIERDYAWRVHVKEDWIKVVTLPAIHLMPFHELPPLPHSQEMSLLSPVLPLESRLG